MKRESKAALRSFLVELAVYAVLVTAYYFLVLHLLGDWLAGLFHNDRVWYAVVALLFIFVQGVVLEWLTRLLLDWVKRPPLTE